MFLLPWSQRLLLLYSTWYVHEQTPHHGLGPTHSYENEQVWYVCIMCMYMEQHKVLLWMQQRCVPFSKRENWPRRLWVGLDKYLLPTIRWHSLLLEARKLHTSNYLILYKTVPNGLYWMHRHGQ
jgi:hypothetical protein